MFYTVKELVEQSHAFSSVAELMVHTEVENSTRTEAQIRHLMSRNLEVMERSVKEGIAGVKSVTGLTGGEAKKLNHYIADDRFMSGKPIMEAVRNAVAVNEVNAKMGLICATPTAGSAGVLAGVLLAMRDRLHLTHDQQLDFLLPLVHLAWSLQIMPGLPEQKAGARKKLARPVRWLRRRWFVLMAAVPNRQPPPLRLRCKTCWGWFVTQLPAWWRFRV